MGSDENEPVEGEIVPEGGDAPDSGVGGGADPMSLLGGGLDLGSMMQMAADMQQQVAASQERLASAQVVGTAGGGSVEVTLNGHLHLLGIRIDPSAVDHSDITMTEDLIRAAWQDAHDQVAALQSEADPLGGLGDLGGLLGGG